ncbi:DUF4232 domain-containing protein [Streptomyces noursei]|uniref:DUF4232 domain-containing protein n=1 Tax=Streptomyces noursei TaxID=1971 RepID=UPI0033D0EA01
MLLTTKTRGRCIAISLLIFATTLTLTACQNGTDSASWPWSTVSSGSVHSAPPTGITAQAQDHAARQLNAPSPDGARLSDSGVPAISQAKHTASTESWRCIAANMSLHLGRIDIGAGNIHIPLVFTNIGKRRCRLRGFPGVSLIQRDGASIGKSASREGNAGHGVQLLPGQSAHAVLHTLNKGISDIPCRKHSQCVFVYPPGSKAPMTVNSGGLRVCGGTFTVTSVQAGSLDY